MARRPPKLAHFLSQRVRQAYDELARPFCMAIQLAFLPAALVGTWFYPLSVAGGLVGVIIAAGMGRRKGGGDSVFPKTSALWAIPWVTERSVTAWIALDSRLFLGGVRYRKSRMKRAATPMRVIRKALAPR